MRLKINYSERDEKYWIGVGDEVHWFDGPLAAQDGLRRLETEQAEQSKVAEIVAWMREQQEGRTSDNYPGYYARQIEERFGATQQKVLDR